MNSVRSVCSISRMTSFWTVSIRNMRMMTSTANSLGNSDSTRAACSERSFDRITATVCGYSWRKPCASTVSLTLDSLSHIVRPEGPRISSMMSLTRSPGKMPESKRSVDS